MKACAVTAKKFSSTALLNHPQLKYKPSLKPQPKLVSYSPLIPLCKLQVSFAIQIWPQSYACSCSYNNANITAAEADAEMGSGGSVRVKLILHKECEFGEEFSAVGEDAVLGSWDPKSAILMTWSPGHIWATPILDLPAGKMIYFKFILGDKEGEIQWQPGPDRVFQTRESRGILLVSQDWDDFDLQTIAEEQIEDHLVRGTQEIVGAEIEDQVIREEIAEAGVAVVERGELNGGVPVLVPGLKNGDCLKEEVWHAEQSPVAVMAAEEEEEQKEIEERSSYVENGSAVPNHHASVSVGEKTSTPSVAETSAVVVEGEEAATSSTTELIENEDSTTSTESSCNEGEDSNSVDYELGTSVVQKDLDWGRSVLSKLIWSLGLKPE